MACKAGTGNTWDQWLSDSRTTPQPLVDDSVLVNIAASVGATSKDWTLCFAVAAMKARRLIYFRSIPGDCGTKNLSLPGQTIGELAASQLTGQAASLDPEPISKGILSGISSIVGIFGAHHAAAVKNEQDTNCAVSTGYNQAATSIEQAVIQGLMPPDQASALIGQVAAQLDPVLAAITKQCNVSCGMRLALKALVKYNEQIVMQALTPATNIPGLTPFLSPEPVASPGAPGTFQGASGYTPTPMNGGNMGVGSTSFPFLGNLSVGEVVIIGGIAYVVGTL